MAAWGSTVYQRSWDLKEAIDAASSHDDLQDIDIQAGGPARPLGRASLLF